MEMNNYYNQQGMPMYNAYDPNLYGYGAYSYGNMPAPANQNALTSDEIQALKNARPTNKIDLNIDRNDLLKSMCTHKDNGRDVVVQVNDGSGDVYCPICQQRWNPDMESKEEVQVLVDKLIDQMQNAKWVGDLPVDLTRDLFTLIPLLMKYPNIHEYAMNTFNKYYTTRGMYNAQDANIYGMYNSLFGATNYAPQAPYYGQPMAAPQQPQGYYGQAPAYGNNVVNPMVNPMQAPTYGVNPMAPNQQFVQQANTMMNGSVYGQPMAAPQAPVFGTPQVPQNNAGPVVGPAAQQQTPINNDATITNQVDGTVKSASKIDL